MTQVSWDTILRAAELSLVTLPSELVGYLVLALADRGVKGPIQFRPSSVFLDADGRVEVHGCPPASPEEMERLVRSLLGRMLLLAGPGPAALRRVGQREELSGLAELVREIATALVPLNRAAAVRAMMRLHRQVAALIDNGRLPPVSVPHPVPERPSCSPVASLPSVVSAEAKPSVQVASAEAKPSVQAASAEAKPSVQVASVEAKPSVQAVSVEAKPSVQAASAEAKPSVQARKGLASEPPRDYSIPDLVVLAAPTLCVASRAGVPSRQTEDDPIIELGADDFVELEDEDDDEHEHTLHGLGRLSSTPALFHSELSVGAEPRFSLVCPPTGALPVEGQSGTPSVAPRSEHQPWPLPAAAPSDAQLSPTVARAGGGWDPSVVEPPSLDSVLQAERTVVDATVSVDDIWESLDPANPSSLSQSSASGDPSGVEHMAEHFGVSPSPSSDELCRDLRHLAGIDFTPLGAMVTTATPPPVAAGEQSRGAAPRPRGSKGRTFGGMGVFLAVGLLGASLWNPRDPRLSLSRSPDEPLSQLCRASVHVVGVPPDASLRFRQAGDSEYRAGAAENGEAWLRGLHCLRELTILVDRPSNRGWRTLPVAADWLTAESAVSPVAVTLDF